MTPRRAAVRALSWTLAAGLALGPAAAHALPTDPEAKAHLDRGNAAFGKGDFDTAVEEYKKGYAKQDDPAFLYTWAQAERKRGRCAAAVKLYKRYIATNPPEMSAEAARDGIVSCAEALAADDPLPPDDEPTPDDGADEPADPGTPPPPADEPPPPAAKPPRPWNRDPAGIVLLSLGVAGVGAGIGLLAGSWSWLERADNYGEYDHRANKLRGFQIGGGILLAVGVGAIAGGAARLALLKKREGARTGGTSAMLGPGLVGLQFTRRF